MQYTYQTPELASYRVAQARVDRAYALCAYTSKRAGDALNTLLDLGHDGVQLDDPRYARTVRAYRAWNALHTRACERRYVLIAREHDAELAAYSAEWQHRSSHAALTLAQLPAQYRVAQPRQKALGFDGTL